MPNNYISHIEKENVGGLLGGGGGEPKGMLPPPPPELFGGGPGPPVTLSLCLCSLPNIYFSSDTVCWATVYPERERDRQRELMMKITMRRDRERERERERCGTSRYEERSEVKDKS